MMPPLLLIPLVENAFKHGVSVSRGKRFVDVRCVVKERKLNFVVKNSIRFNYRDRKPPIENGRDKRQYWTFKPQRRLDLLYKIDLVTEQKDSVFKAMLTINLQAMSKVKCIIIEDEPLARQILEGYISRVPFLEIRGSLRIACGAMNHLRDHPADLMFLKSTFLKYKEYLLKT